MNTQTQPIKRTPIDQLAQGLNAQFVEQNGWRVVNVFSDVAAELEAAQHRVALADLSDRGKVMIEGIQAAQVVESALGASGLEIGRGVVAGSASLFRLRRDLFYAGCAAEAESEVLGTLERAAAASSDLVTVTEVTHGRAQLQLVGPASAELLSHLCGLDFYETEFQNLTAKQSSVAKTAQLIIRQDINGLPAYALIGARSLAAYLWETIVEAGVGLGLRSIGRAALRQVK